MKNFKVSKLILVVALTGFASSIAHAQNFKKLHIGFFAGYGKDYYTRKLRGSGSIPEATNHFESKRSMEFGVYGEKFVFRRMSVLPKISYVSQNVPANTLCNCSHLDYLQKETHHMPSLGLGLRRYLAHGSAVNAFLGAGLLADYFLGYTEKRNDNTRFHWSSQGYNRINPSVSGELGLQWKRIGLLAEYKSNLANTFSKGYKLSTGGGVRRSIFRHGFSIKMSFLLTPIPPEN